MACLSAKPVVDGLEDELGGRATFLRAKIQSPAGQALADRYGVETVPTFLLFDRDGRLVRSAARVPAAELRALTR